DGRWCHPGDFVHNPTKKSTESTQTLLTLAYLRDDRQILDRVDVVASIITTPSTQQKGQAN
ncbi:hypothetical protein EIP91_003031, partial [Steccherinum ochraceum]